MGQSSGGTSILALIASPKAVGLFGAAYVMSASYVFNTTLEQAGKDNQIFVSNAGCDHITRQSSISEYDCLMALSPSSILSSIPWFTYPYWGGANQMDLPQPSMFQGGIVIIEPTYLPLSPIDAKRSGIGSDVPLIVGSMAQEIDLIPTQHMYQLTPDEFNTFIRDKFSKFTGDTQLGDKILQLYQNVSAEGDAPIGGISNSPIDSLNPTPEGLRSQFLYETIASDIGVTCGTTSFAQLYSTYQSSPVYRYVMSTPSSNPICVETPLVWCSRNAFHTLDMLSLFDTTSAFWDGNDQNAKEMGNLLRERIGEFIANGGKIDPEKWRSVSGDTTGLAVVGVRSGSGEAVLEMRDGFRKEQCAFWTENSFIQYGWSN